LRFAAEFVGDFSFSIRKEEGPRKEAQGMAAKSAAQKKVVSIGWVNL
jgi:hypothetical protein